MVPTCWLLCGFLSPEIITDTSIWSSTLCLPLLDQMLIRGNPCFALYLLLAIFKENEQILLKAKTVELEYGSNKDEMPKMFKGGE